MAAPFRVVLSSDSDPQTPDAGPHFALINPDRKSINPEFIILGVCLGSITDSRNGQVIGHAVCRAETAETHANDRNG